MTIPTEQEVKPKKRGCGHNGSPPLKPINFELFEQLCAVQCTQSEISSMLKVCEDTLRTRVNDHYKEEYSVIYKKFAESGKCSLRRIQFVQARTKPNMAIWLGKQWLNQKDNITDFKEFMIHELRAGLKAISNDERSAIAGGSKLATESPLPNSEQKR
jgi:hypothetical protein